MKKIVFSLVFVAMVGLSAIHFGRIEEGRQPLCTDATIDILQLN